jgi:phosphoserine phosphatase RsbU/P
MTERERDLGDPTTEDLEDLYENAPCGYLSIKPDGRIVKVNATFSRWIGWAPEQLIGKRFLDLLNIAGRIFYETHFAPLLRMQGFFHEVALDFQTQQGKSFGSVAKISVGLRAIYERMRRRFRLPPGTVRR